MRATRALVYVDRFQGNIRAVRERVGSGRRICVPIKADAYGHGALPMARAALEAGAEFLAVALVQEGEELRQGGLRVPILLFSPCLPDELGDLVRCDLIPFAGDMAFIDALAKAASRAGKDLTVHLKVDTGMGRVGCRPEDALSLARRIVSHKSLRLGGMATHLAASDSLLPEDLASTRDQLERFEASVNAVREAGIEAGIVHAANTGGVLFHPGSWFDMVRPGILLYGYPPPGGGIAARPVMELHSKVTSIKKIRRGEPVSYGRTWYAPEDTLIATIPVGYGDGLRRGLSNNWQVGIGGAAYPIAGRICMDQCMICLGPSGGGVDGGAAVSPGDEVVIFGDAAPPGDAADMAERLGTIPYEITCGIGKRVPRVYCGARSNKGLE
jgi:alanine racemase